MKKRVYYKKIEQIENTAGKYWSKWDEREMPMNSVEVSNF